MKLNFNHVVSLNRIVPYAKRLILPSPNGLIGGGVEKRTAADQPRIQHMAIGANQNSQSYSALDTRAQCFSGVLRFDFAQERSGLSVLGELKGRIITERDFYRFVS